MRKKHYIALFVVLVLVSFTGRESEYRYLHNESFGRGEYVKYRAHVGFITAGEGTMMIHDKLYPINGRECYKVDVYGKTSGFWDFFIKVRDYWGTYIDTAAIVPHRFVRNIEEGKYRKYEMTEFDHLQDSVHVHTYDNETRELKKLENLAVPDNVQDLVSGYYYLRTVDFSGLDVGDTIKVDAIFENELYDFKSRFLGREKLDTDIGEYDALVISPIMPETSIFDGEDAVKVWVSDDKNKVPLKVKAAMWVGSLGLEITEYRKGKD